jgi:hypothetical protein
MLLKQIGLCLRKWTYSFAELLMFFPIILTVMHFFIIPEQRLLLLISFSFIYFASILLYELVKIQSVAAHLLIASAVGVVAAFVSDSLISGAVVGALCAYFWMRGNLVARFAPGLLYPDAHFWIGLIIYFVSYIPFRYYPPLNEELYYIYTLSGTILIIMALFLFNEMRLEKVSLTVGKVNNRYSVLLRHNRIYMTCFLVIVTGAAFAVSKLQLFNGGFRLSRSMPIPFTPGGGGTYSRLGGSGQSSGFHLPDVLLGEIVLYIVGAIIAFYTFRNLYRLLGMLKRLLIRVYAWFRWFLLGLGKNPVLKIQGYEDEYSRIDFFGMTKKKSNEDGLLARIAKWLERETRWEQLPNNREKIRYIYRHWMFHFMRKGYVFKRSLTPSETHTDLRLDDHEAEQSGRQLIALYERARYGGETVSVSDEEAEQLRETLSKNNKNITI